VAFGVTHKLKPKPAPGIKSLPQSTSTIFVAVGEIGSLAQDVMHFAAAILCHLELQRCLEILESFYGIATHSLMAQGISWGS
jgi:hypothetical protein